MTDWPPNEPELHARVRAAERVAAGLEISAAGAAAIEAPWHHQARLPTGEVVGGGKSLAILEAEFAAAFDPLPMAGATVLDVGAWHGSFSFEAERRGAGRVVAVDEYCWFFGYIRGLETFLFLRRALGSQVGYVPAGIPDTTAEKLGTFNVVLFLGVFYHLQDPLRCLEQLARIADPWLVVETQCDLLHDPLPAMRYYPGAELAGDPTNWWAPNPPCMVALLRNAGFAEVTVTPHPLAPGRFFFHARKG